MSDPTLCSLALIGMAMVDDVEQRAATTCEELGASLLASREGGSPDSVEAFLRCGENARSKSDLLEDCIRALRKKIGVVGRQPHDEANIKDDVRDACVVLISISVPDSACVLRMLRDGRAATLKVSDTLFATARLWCNSRTCMALPRR